VTETFGKEVTELLGAGVILVQDDPGDDTEGVEGGRYPSA
jgi:hypothetical protein